MNLSTIFRGPATVDPPRLTLEAAPAVELWSASDSQVQQFLRLDSTTDTALVNMALVSARKYFERITGLALITQTWKVSFDNLPVRQGQFGLEYGLAPTMSRFTGTAAGREIQLGRAPFFAVSAFKYLDGSGAEQTFDAANYTIGNVGLAQAFGRVWLNEDAAWPDVGSFPGALRITFTAGFGDAATDVPEDIRLAVLWLAGHWYEHRLPVNDAGLVELPFHLQDMINHHRVQHVA